MGYDFNKGMLNAFAGDEMFDPNYDLKDINDIDMLEARLFEKEAYNNRNTAQLSGLVSVLSNRTVGYESSTVTWSYGDMEESTTLMTDPGDATFDFDTATPDVNLYLDITSLVPGDFVFLHGYASSTYYDTLVKVTALRSATGYYVVEIVDFDTNDGVATSYNYEPSDVPQVTIHVATTEFDGRAGNPNFITPKLVKNYMERIRTSAAINTHTNADFLNFDGGIGAQMRLKLQTFYERLNHTLVERAFSQDAVAVTGNVGRMKTFKDFYGPHKTDGDGFNVVFPSTGITRPDFEDWVGLMGHYGSKQKEKVIVGTPAMIKAIYRLYESLLTIQVSEFKVPGSVQIWEGITLTLLTGKVHLLPDDSFYGKKITVIDNCINTAQISNTAKWAVVLDMDFTKFVYKDVPMDPNDPGVQSISVRPVDSYGRDSREQQEINAEMTLYLKNPLQGGYCSLNE